jgi:hypothetical protein
MCPVCLATAALAAGKVTTAGGLAAIVLKKFHAGIVTNKTLTQTQTKENPNGK